MNVILLFVLHWYLSLFFQTFYLHRYCSHKMFELSPVGNRVFYFLTYIFQGPSFLNPRAYAIMHMRHHQHSDSQHDPHSPRNYSSIWSMMMDTYKTYHKTILESQVTNNPEYLKIPAWPKLDSYAQSRLNVFMWISIYIGVYYFLSIPLYLYPMIALHSLVGPIQGAIVNWYGHKKGYQNYDNHDDSKNTLPIDLALMGELYQNNHHQNGKRLNFAHQWFEIDVTYHIARVLNFFKIIKI